MHVLTTYACNRKMHKTTEDVKMKNDLKNKTDSGLRSENLQKCLQADIGIDFTNWFKTDNPSNT